MPFFKRRFLLSLVGCLALSGGLHCADSSLDLPGIKLNGFIQSWTTAGGIDRGGSFVKHLRLKLQADVTDGASLVVLPELAGGFTLLDGYASFNLEKFPYESPIPLIVTAGQFKTPFGQNRMFTPTQLYAVDYSIISKALFEGSSFWDDGLMVTYLNPYLRLDVAAVEGLGPNIFPPVAGATDAFGKKLGQDFCGRLETYLLDKTISLGGSVYQGYGFKTPGVQLSADSKLWTGAHARFKLLGQRVELQAEGINRDDKGWGATGFMGVWITDWLQWVTYYDHVEDYNRVTLAIDQSRLGGGLNYLPGKGVRLSLQVTEDTAKNVDLSTAGSPNYLLQAQAVF